MDRYLSNLLSDNITAYSCKTDSENASLPTDIILLRTNEGFKDEKIAALTITFVSATKYLSAIGLWIIVSKKIFHCFGIPFHQFTKLFYCKAALSGFN